MDSGNTGHVQQFLEEILQQIDQGIPIDIAYLDFSKAFDRVPWKPLMRKVEALGVNVKVLGWLKGWLTDRW